MSLLLRGSSFRLDNVYHAAVQIVRPSEKHIEPVALRTVCFRCLEDFLTVNVILIRGSSRSIGIVVEREAKTIIWAGLHGVEPEIPVVEDLEESRSCIVASAAREKVKDKRII